MSEARRAVDIIFRADGARSFGSGCLISDRLVLTANHVLKGRGRGAACMVRLIDLSPIDAVVLWSGASQPAPVDLAILQLQEPAPGVPAGLIRLGAPSGLDDLKCRGVGFPEIQRRDEIDEDWRLKGELNWVRRTRSGKPRFNVAVEAPTPETHQDWQGFSGAGLFCEGRLAAVVSSVRPRWRGQVLSATPTQRLREAAELPALLGLTREAFARRFGASEDASGPLRLTAADSAFQLDVGRFVEAYLADALPGRDAEIAALNAWIGDAAAPPRLLLAGPGGRGKSALLTAWLRQLDEGWRRIFIPISLRYETNELLDVYRAVATSLARLLGERPAAATEGLSNWRGEAAEWGERAAEDGIRCVVVVDGLDEASGGEFIDVLPAELGGGLRLLVSARPLAGDAGAADWRRRLGWDTAARQCRTLELDRLSAPAIDALAGELLGGSGPAVSRLGAQLYRLSDGGEPLIVGLYLDDLRNGELGVGDWAEQLQDRRPGLKDYFEGWFARWEAQAGAAPDVVARSKVMLAVLACAHGPLSLAELQSVVRRTGLGVTLMARSELAPIRRFVIGDGQQSGFVLTHPRFGDYLREVEFGDGDVVARCRAAFLDWGRQDIAAAQGPARPPIPRYLLSHFTSHLMSSGEASAEDWSRIASTAWIQARRDQSGGDWDVCADLHQVLDWAMGQPPDRLPVGLALRATILLSSVSHALWNAGAALPGLSLKHRLVDQRTALRQLENLPHRDIPEALTVIAPQLDPEGRQQALEIARGLYRATYCAEALSVLASRWDRGEGIAREALDAALEAAANGANSKWLCGLAVRLPEALRGIAAGAALRVATEGDEPVFELDALWRLSPTPEVERLVRRGFEEAKAGVTTSYGKLRLICDECGRFPGLFEEEVEPWLDQLERDGVPDDETGWFAQAAGQVALGLDGDRRGRALDRLVRWSCSHGPGTGWTDAAPDIWPHLDPEQRRRILRALIQDARVHGADRVRYDLHGLSRVISTGEIEVLRPIAVEILQGAERSTDQAHDARIAIAFGLADLATVRRILKHAEVVPASSTVGSAMTFLAEGDDDAAAAAAEALAALSDRIGGSNFAELSNLAKTLPESRWTLFSDAATRMLEGAAPSTERSQCALRLASIAPGAFQAHWTRVARRYASYVGDRRQLLNAFVALSSRISDAATAHGWLERLVSSKAEPDEWLAQDLDALPERFATLLYRWSRGRPRADIVFKREFRLLPYLPVADRSALFQDLIAFYSLPGAPISQMSWLVEPVAADLTANEAGLLLQLADGAPNPEDVFKLLLALVRSTVSEQALQRVEAIATEEEDPRRINEYCGLIADCDVAEVPHAMSWLTRLSLRLLPRIASINQWDFLVAGIRNRNPSEASDDVARFILGAEEENEFTQRVLVECWSWSSPGTRRRIAERIHTRGTEFSKSLLAWRELVMVEDIIAREGRIGSVMSQLAVEYADAAAGVWEDISGLDSERRASLARLALDQDLGMHGDHPGLFQAAYLRAFAKLGPGLEAEALLRFDRGSSEAWIDAAIAAAQRASPKDRRRLLDKAQEAARSLDPEARPVYLAKIRRVTNEGPPVLLGALSDGMWYLSRAKLGEALAALAPDVQELGGDPAIAACLEALTDVWTLWP